MLQVTSKKDQQQYWARKDEPYSYITVKEFADSFRAFHVGVKLQTDLATPFDNAEGSKSLLTATKYGVQRKELLKACFAKEYLLMKRNSFVYIFKFCQVSTEFHFNFSTSCATDYDLIVLVSAFSLE